MVSSNLLRRAGILAAGLGATAAIGVAPAAAKVTGENIYGSGSSLQGIAQINMNHSGDHSSGTCPVVPGVWQGWVAQWKCIATNQSGLSNPGLSATYTVSGSGPGLAEFGDQASSGCTPAAVAGVLNPQCDPTAHAVGQLDAFFGTDDPPNAAQIASGHTAGGTDQVTVPVLQAPVAILFSLPAGITVGTNGEFHLSGAGLAKLYGSANGGSETWCTLLGDSGLKLDNDADALTSTEYKDPTGACSSPITVQARASGSGTTYSIRGDLYVTDKDLGLADYPYASVNDGPAGWATPVVTTGNTSSGNLVANTTNTPGSVGYANLADAALQSPNPYKDTVQTTADGTHQYAYAEIQNNLQSDNPSVTPVFASPAGGIGVANVYTGANISQNPTTCNPPHTVLAVGCWVVPASPTGAWSSAVEAMPGTIASDPDVRDHGSNSGAYPIVAASFDVAWSTYSTAQLAGMYTDASCSPSPPAVSCEKQAGNSAVSYLTYITGTGQGDLAAAKKYYAKMPAVIAAIGKRNAAAIRP